MFANPRQNLKYLNLLPGHKVADLGAGGGDYTLAAAEAVGPTGRVFAVEVQKELLDRLRGQAQTAGLGNVDIIWGDIEVPGGVKLADQSVDAVIISNILFQVDSQFGLAREAKRILVPKGQALVVDWQDSYGGLGPLVDQVFDQVKATEVMTKAGLTLTNTFDAGDHHYGLVFSNT
ncbi:MAG: hypothetical protein A2589_02555 [Candidatus Vogelbacteria bacterium RIFOXYD1_FULL_46_19]|uniref:Methyltransferase domain-containing protein n=1 Tax=Candidatus Vogelbacteria bacterium RIFOXYD1_FULL_46_19 TaxID=1802439 RepID=A0A1G2QHK4_9BACT|nr:MAG: hypothetical protein A2589_02555 [Candidatus Vogelbacteria bacterium RIFOXYD1_FULL_46_19]